MARRLHGKRFKVRLVDGDDDDDPGSMTATRDACVTERLRARVRFFFFLKMHNGHARPTDVFVSVRPRESID